MVGLGLCALPALAQNAAVTVDIDVNTNRRAISPYIYGVAYGTQAQLSELNSPLNRWGGNATSRYNWQLNAANRANDWYYESLPYSGTAPGAEVDAFIGAAKAAQSEAIITIPMVGWVAKLGPNRSGLASFSIAKYGAQQDADHAWFPDAGNGVWTNGQFVSPNDPNDANVPADPLFQKGWVQHLVQQWGPASSGGVRLYAMDNESSIWYLTHRDVHPTGPTMDEVRDKHLAYANAVKEADPGALILGPEEWGWGAYFYSGYDQKYTSDNGWGTFPDRAAHGNWDYVPWLLDQLRQNEQSTGVRPLDVFTLHYYPQGGEFGNDTSASMQNRRNRSTRSLWDPNYVDESWIGDTVKLIPRMKQWVQQYYPGTQTGITEYNWGAESHINGATTQADILGIFGREGLDYATRWEVPASNTPTFKAMKMYRNYDGQNSGFGEVSVSCVVPNPDSLSAFAAERSSDGALTVMVISKVLSGDTPVTLNLGGFAHTGVAQRWQLTSANTLTHLSDLGVSGSSVSTSVPQQSVTLFVLPSSGGGGGTENLSPVADAVASPISGLPPLEVSFDGTGSTDSDGTVVAYAWDFGDGQQGAGATVTHTYGTAGTYTATLTVTDDDGATASDSVTVTVFSSGTLEAPSNLFAQASGSNVTLQWTDNSQTEDGFIIERSPQGGWPPVFSEVGRTGPNAQQYVDSNVPSGSYWYRVKSFRGTVVSEPSNMDGVTVH